jgi:hypothetical protein
MFRSPILRTRRVGKTPPRPSRADCCAFPGCCLSPVCFAPRNRVTQDSGPQQGNCEVRQGVIDGPTAREGGVVDTYLHVEFVAGYGCCRSSREGGTPSCWCGSTSEDQTMEHPEFVVDRRHRETLFAVVERNLVECIGDVDAEEPYGCVVLELRSVVDINGAVDVE